MSYSLKSNDSLSPEQWQQLKEQLGRKLNDNIPKNLTPGPIRILLNQKESFNEIHLLSDFPAELNKLYGEWLNRDVCIHDCKLSDPTNYRDVFIATNDYIAGVYNDIPSNKKDTVDFHFFLTSGTSTMTAIWVLLGKSQFPAKFWQTFNNMAYEVDIPFDLTVDLLPVILKDSDSSFHNLSSRQMQEIEGFQGIKGSSEAIHRVKNHAKRIALWDVSVLLLGESGTGKELFANAIHNASRRKDKPFIAINCAALPGELFESEIFGYVKGTFTGADKDKEGALKQADRGTLFLDEIGELPLPQQAKLLRALQPPQGESPCCREFSPLGTKEPITCDVRIIAATNRNLIQDVVDGRFREDLYYRLAQFTINLPPLRERKEDIVDIAQLYLDNINENFIPPTKKKIDKDKSFSDDALKFLNSYDWPGNARQLYNAVLQAVVLSDENEITRKELESAVANFSLPPPFTPITIEDGFSLEKHLFSVERPYLEKAVEMLNDEKKCDVAKKFGFKSHQTLNDRLKKHGLGYTKKVTGD